jgi:hypothetical protein
MIKNILIISLLLFLSCSCNLRRSMTEPAILSYKSSNIEADFVFKDRAKIKKESWEKGDYRYFYYGTMTSKLTSMKKLKQLLLVYNGEESEVYMDTIASVNFWNESWWDKTGSRQNEIYVSFDEPNVDWSVVKISEKEVPKKASIEKVCKLVSPESQAAKDCAKMGY